MLKKSILTLVCFLFLISAACENIFNAPDEPSLLYRHILKTYVIDIATKKKSFLVDGEHPIPIPNSDKILYKNDDKLYSVGYDGRGNQFISEAPGASSDHSFLYDISSDGSKFAFIGWQKQYGENDLFILDLDDHTLNNITKSTLSSEATPVFNPRNNEIFYKEAVKNNSGKLIYSSISKIDIEGGNYRQLYPKGGGNFVNFLPEEEKIIFFQYGSATGLALFFLSIEDTSSLQKINIGQENIYRTTEVTAENDIYYLGDKKDIYKLNLVSLEKEIVCSGQYGETVAFSHNLGKMVYYKSPEFRIVDFFANTDELLFEQDDINVWYITFSNNDDKVLFTTYKEIQYYKNP